MENYTFSAFNECCRKKHQQGPCSSTFLQQCTQQKTSPKGLLLTSFCHNPHLQLERYFSVQLDLQMLGTNVLLFANSLHTPSTHPSGGFLYIYIAILTKTSIDSLPSRFSISASIQGAGTLAGTSQSLF